MSTVHRKRRCELDAVALRTNLIAYYGAANPLPGNVPDEEKRSARIRLQLASLTATQTSAIGR